MAGFRSIRLSAHECLFTLPYLYLVPAIKQSLTAANKTASGCDQSLTGLRQSKGTKHSFAMYMANTLNPRGISYGG